MTVNAKNEIEHVSKRVTQLSGGVIDFYKSSPKQFMVYDTHEATTGTVVSLDMYGGGEKQHFEPIQTIRYDGETVVEITPDLGYTNHYSFDPIEKVIHFGTSYVDYGNGQWHDINGTLSEDEQSLREISRIQVHTDLHVNYRLVRDGDRLGFESTDVMLHGYLPLPPEDVSKFMQKPRFIDMNDMLAVVADPCHADNSRSQSRVPELSYWDGFPKLDYGDVGPHSKTFVTTLDHDHDKIFGFAHPLKDDYDGWLIFARFQDGKDAIGRALIVRADRQSLDVSEIDGVPTIKIDITVDGTPYSLVLPEPRVSPEKITDDNRAKAIDIRVIDGEERGFIPITTEHLMATVGSYYGDVLNGALQLHYDAWVKSRNIRTSN